MKKDLQKRLIRVANALEKLAEKDIDFSPVLQEIEDDFRRKAITHGEKDELKEAVRNADSLKEAWKIVYDHRKGRA